MAASQTDYVAWYGAVLATVGIVLQLVRYLEGRKPRVKIGLSEGVWDHTHVYVNICVANTGKRPTTLNSAHLRLGTGESVFAYVECPPIAGGDKLPSTIGEGEVCNLRIDREMLREVEKDYTSKAKYLEIRDAAGHRFRAPWRIP
jgi:hypothetical protein